MDIQKRADAILCEILSADGTLKNYVVNRSVPSPFHGRGKIRLVVLGQDPTVKNPESRDLIKTVLNLNKKGNLRKYLSRICDCLGFGLEESVYATNVIKNFFTSPPTTITDCNVLVEASRYWLGLLKDEINQFPDAVILSLGEPVLSILVRSGNSRCVRDYWGYTSRWKLGECGDFRAIEISKCELNRKIFPFPHQPSIAKRFYKQRFENYLAFMKNQI